MYEPYSVSCGRGRADEASWRRDSGTRFNRVIAGVHSDSQAEWYMATTSCLWGLHVRPERQIGQCISGQVFGTLTLGSHLQRGVTLDNSRLYPQLSISKEEFMLQRWPLAHEPRSE